MFEESDFVGESLASTILGEKGDLRVLGLWKGGEFRNAPDESTVIEKHDVLLVVGPTETLERLEQEMAGPDDGRATICLAGYGEVGASVANSLEDGGISCTIVDLEDGEEIDVVGDVTNEATLAAAGIGDVDVFVLSIPNDDEAILATLVARERNPDLDIIARVNDKSNTTMIRRAGADYVLSLPEISGRLLARDVLREQILAYDTQLQVVQIDGESVAGKTVEETGLKETSSVLIGVERNGGIETQIADDYRFREDDTLLLVSTEDALGTIESEIR